MIGMQNFEFLCLYGGFTLIFSLLMLIRGYKIKGIEQSGNCQMVYVLDFVIYQILSIALEVTFSVKWYLSLNYFQTRF